ncbi:MAG: hypothetical protein AAFN70_13135 [Planctomycetota bacterium]
MKTYAKFTIFALLVLMFTTNESMAQGRLKGKIGGGKRGPTVLKPEVGNSSDKRQDVEGTVWEFKVIDPKEKDESKQTIMTGRIRIKQSSVFAVGKVKMAGENEKKGAEAKGTEGSDVRGKFKGLLSQRMNESKSATTGSERIGDLSKATSSEYSYEFDQDDNYPLSGLVKIKPDTQKKNGVWSGNYEEFSGGKKVKRWRFEMRKIEE